MGKVSDNKSLRREGQESHETCSRAKCEGMVTNVRGPWTLSKTNDEGPKT